MASLALQYRIVDSPFGPVTVAGSGDVLRCLRFPVGSQPAPIPHGWVRDDAILKDVVTQLEEYWAGRLVRFDVNFAFRGNTLQESVWRQMLAIPYGETRTYGEIAGEIGQPVSASRAVGTACGENPLPIIVPCHRVIGANAKLVGFGGGLEIKKYLLDLEFRVAPPRDTLFYAAKQA